MNTHLLIAFGLLLLFGLLISYAVQYSKKKEEQRQQTVRSMGFTAIETSATLTDRINQFYSWDKSSSQTTLSNVFHKTLPDGEMYLFGLNDSDTEQQTIAILSPDLSLPKFMIFPRIEMDNAAGKLVNKALIWAISRVETPLEFPEVPEFQERYMVSSPNPDSARRFLDANLLRQLTQTKQYVIRAD